MCLTWLDGSNSDRWSIRGSLDKTPAVLVYLADEMDVTGGRCVLDEKLEAEV